MQQNVELAMRQRRKILIGKPSHIQAEKVSMMWVNPQLKWCVYADEDLDAGRTVCPYGGRKFTSEKSVEKMEKQGFDKLLRVKDKNIWYGGSLSKTVGPSLTHACDCEANCEIQFNKNVPHVVTKQFIPGGRRLRYQIRQERSTSLLDARRNLRGMQQTQFHGRR